MPDEVQEHRLRRAGQPQRGSAGPAQTTILIVDDDQAVRDLICEVLTLHGYQVVTTATAEQAEEVLQRQGPQAIGLVIADVHLTADPCGLEGYELYQRWSTAHSELRFFLISGDPNSRTLPAIRSGAVGFLAKPFSMSGLVDAVQALLGG
jgi:DNA-binding NtrC family response regulator